MTALDWGVAALVTLPVWLDLDDAAALVIKPKEQP